MLSSTWSTPWHNATDTLTAVASCSISLLLISALWVHRRRRNPFRLVYLGAAVAFGVDGLDHWTQHLQAHSHAPVSVPHFWFSALNAAVNTYLAYAAAFLFPQILKSKTEAEQHVVIEAALQDEVLQRQKAEKALAALNRNLQLEVNARTKAMAKAYDLVVQEIEQRKGVEAQLRALTESLDERVRSRTVELEELNKELDQFAGSVSHDLRAPIRAINGFATLLAVDHAEEMSAEAVHLLDELRSSSLRMGDLVQSLLNFSRQAGRAIKREEVDLSAIAEASLKERELLDGAGRVVDWHVEKGITVVADRHLAEVVMQNLISNAWKYTAQRNPAVIRVFSLLQGGVPWIHVTDNGVGFDPSKADGLFRPFHRLHSAAGFPGQGIGLSIVRRIIARHGGRIEFASAPGTGAKFWFNFGDVGTHHG